MSFSFSFSFIALAVALAADSLGHPRTPCRRPDSATGHCRTLRCTMGHTAVNTGFYQTPKEELTYQWKTRAQFGTHDTNTKFEFIYLLCLPSPHPTFPPLPPLPLLFHLYFSSQWYTHCPRLPPILASTRPLPCILCSQLCIPTAHLSALQRRPANAP